MNVMEEIFEIRSCIEILANDIKVNTADNVVIKYIIWHITNTFIDYRHSALREGFKRLTG